MIIKVFVRNEPVRIILARRNKNYEWLACQMSVTSNYLWQLLEMRRCPSHKLRDKMMKALRVKGEKWDQIFVFDHEFLNRR